MSYSLIYLLCKHLTTFMYTWPIGFHGEIALQWTPSVHWQHKLVIPFQGKSDFNGGCVHAFWMPEWIVFLLLFQWLGSLFALQVAVEVYAFDTLINPLDNKTELIYYNARNGYKELAFLNDRKFDIVQSADSTVWRCETKPDKKGHLHHIHRYSVNTFHNLSRKLRIYTRMHTRRRESHDSLWRWLKRPGEMWRAWVTVLCFRLVCDLVIKLSVFWMTRGMVQWYCACLYKHDFHLRHLAQARNCWASWLPWSACGENDLCIKHKSRMEQVQMVSRWDTGSYDRKGSEKWETASSLQAPAAIRFSFHHLCDWCVWDSCSFRNCGFTSILQVSCVLAQVIHVHTVLRP